MSFVTTSGRGNEAFTTGTFYQELRLHGRFHALRHKVLASDSSAMIYAANCTSPERSKSLRCHTLCCGRPHHYARHGTESDSARLFSSWFIRPHSLYRPSFHALDYTLIYGHLCPKYHFTCHFLTQVLCYIAGTVTEPKKRPWPVAAGQGTEPSPKTRASSKNDCAQSTVWDDHPIRIRAPDQRKESA